MNALKKGAKVNVLEYTKKTSIIWANTPKCLLCNNLSECKLIAHDI